jgi:hypothetical protein
MPETALDHRAGRDEHTFGDSVDGPAGPDGPDRANRSDDGAAGPAGAAAAGIAGATAEALPAAAAAAEIAVGREPARYREAAYRPPLAFQAGRAAAIM